MLAASEVKDFYDLSLPRSLSLCGDDRLSLILANWVSFCPSRDYLEIFLFVPLSLDVSPRETVEREINRERDG